MKKLWKVWISVLLVCALLLSAAACGAGTGLDEAGSDAEEETILFTDSAGREVAVQSSVERIVPSGSYAQMFLIMLCPEKLLGLSSALTRNQKRYLPDYLAELGTFGQFYGGSGTVNYEAIIAAKPDLIIDIGERKETIEADMDSIQKKTGVPTIFLESSLNSVPETFEALGQVTGEEERAASLAEYAKDVLAMAEENTAAVPENERIRIYCGDGEFGTEANPAGSVHSEVMDLAGAVNVAELSDASDSAREEVPMEQILLWNPEVILLTTDANYDEIYGDPKWESVDAVKNRRVYEIPAAPYNWIDRPPSVQRILGLLWLGNLLYPDRFDYDMTEKMKEFYDLFYHYELSDAEAAELLAHSTGLRQTEEH